MSKTLSMKLCEDTGKKAGFTIKQIHEMLRDFTDSDDDVYGYHYHVGYRRWHVVGHFDLPVDFKRTEKHAISACNQRNLADRFIKIIARKRIDGLIAELDSK